MPPKRPFDGGGNSQDKKRARMREARTIPIQNYPPRTGGSAARGNIDLPLTIEVEKFAQARAFEITAMQRAMKAARQSCTVRAFQSLPRHLRRRAASHNVKRLPSRLRAKAISETPKDSAKPKKLTRKMLGKKRTLYLRFNRTQVLLKRQRKKIWLETHIWHAKRMHMKEVWGHRLAIKPTQKAFRASYRASVHGALLHDASYYQYLELKGTEEHLARLFKDLCDPTAISPASKRYSSGIRECSCLLYSSALDFPSKLIGPVTVIWDTPLPLEPTEQDPPPPIYRKVLIRLHPSISRTAYKKISDCIEGSFNLPERLVIGIIKYEKEFLTFEITGKRATQVVKAVLRPLLATDTATKDAWRKISSIAGPASIPTGMIFGLKVYDPRLSFPPKLDRSNPSLVPNSDVLQPSIQIAQVLPFWDQKERAKIKIPAYKKKDIDARRSALLIPGTPLSAIAQDNRIPMLLSQRTLSSSTSTSNTANERTDEMAGWTLTIPAGWGMAFWQSLVFSETRVGGLRERSQSFFEAGAAKFPEDYPGTAAFVEYETAREVDDRGFWEKKPPAKRANYLNSKTVNPFQAGFDEILLRQSPSTVVATGIDPTLQGISPWIASVSITRLVMKLVQAGIDAEQENNNMEIDVAAPSIIDRSNSTLAAASLAYLLVMGRKVALHETSKDATLFRSALVRVNILPCHRGAPKELALLYELDDEAWNEVRDNVGGSKGRKEAIARDQKDGPEELCDPPLPTAVIGRITTGNYSLKRGHGYAIGAIPLSIWVKLGLRDAKNNISTKYSNLVLFRNRDGEVYRAATLELIE